MPRCRKSFKTDNSSVTNWVSHPQIYRVAELLKQQAVVAYPTESVWGLGCDPQSASAVEKILQLKKRNVDKGLILIGDSVECFKPFLAGLDEEHLRRFRAPTAKPTTWLVPNNGFAPLWISGGRDTLALRITEHPVAAALCTAFGGLLVSTSANPQGLPAAKSALEVEDYFGDAVDMLAPGQVGNSANPSEIRHLISGEIVRAG
jgi:L-threonylcarbamoyladenylate synthase